VVARIHTRTLPIIPTYGMQQYAICRDGLEKNGGHIKSAHMTECLC